MRLPATCFLFLAIGCAGSRGVRRPVSVDEQRSQLATVLAEAHHALEDPSDYPGDCVLFVRAVYKRAGVDLLTDAKEADNGVRAVARYVGLNGRWHRAKVPLVGDLVFFNNSYDRNGDGRLNDEYTHLGIVEDVLHDGTAMIVHATNHGIVREPMNLLHPHVQRDEAGRQINAPLRRRTPEDTAHTPHLMGELFAGFGQVLPRAPLAELEVAQAGR